MDDSWVNIGHESNKLLPFEEPPLNFNDLFRIEKMQKMGFNKDDIYKSLRTGKFDNITATYYLLGSQNSNIEAIDASAGSSLSLQ